MNFDFLDCYCRFDGEEMIIGNSLAEQKISLAGGMPVNEYLKDKETGFEWSSASGGRVAICNIPGFDFSEAEVSAEACVDNNFALCEDQMLSRIVFVTERAKVTLSFRMFPNNRFISFGITVNGKVGENNSEKTSFAEGSDGIENGKEKTNTQAPAGVIMPPPGSINAFGLPERHLKVRGVEFVDVTDRNNTLVRESSDTVYVRHGKKLCSQMFYIEAYTAGETLMLVKDAPSTAGRLHNSDYDVNVLPGYMLDVTGSVDFDELPPECENELYFTTYGAGKAETLTADYKAFFRRSNVKIAADGLIRMSNTWGDRNQDAAVRESFVVEEIKNASRLGVNVLQVDDGWQKGASANSKLVKSNVWGRGYYDSDKDFWCPHPEKFPSGFDGIAKELKERNIRFALWFSPDLGNDYENWQKDAETLTSLYRDFGVCYFKLDGINIRSMREENNLIKMLRYVLGHTDNKVNFNFDITAGRRWGYIYRKEFGNVFIENRYTDWGNYYPHYTLRNLWQLAKYLPLARFQAEFLNLRRNAAKYGDDVFAPDKYEMDYAFAITMFACPLYWFELQNLSERDKEKLGKIAAVHAKIDKKLALADVSPIGEEPDGIAFTGFWAKTESEHGFLLLFREGSEESKYEFACRLPENARLRTLYASEKNVTAERTQNGVRFESPCKRTFILLEY